MATYSAEVDERHARRTLAQRAVPLGASHAAPHAQQNRLLYAGGLLGDARLQGQANAPVQTALIQGMQAAYGNRAVGRYLSGAHTAQPRHNRDVQRFLHRQHAVSVQRCDCGSADGATREEQQVQTMPMHFAQRTGEVQRCGGEIHEGCSCAPASMIPIEEENPVPAQRMPAGSIPLQRLTAAEKEQDLQSEKYSGNARLQKAFDNSPSMHIGESGDAVRLVQEGLRDAGIPMPGSTKPTGEMDGAFGGETLKTVKAFQAQNSLGVDGIVGRQTMGKLDELAQSGPPKPPEPLPPCPPDILPIDPDLIFTGQLPPLSTEAQVPIPGVNCIPPCPIPILGGQTSAFADEKTGAGGGATANPAQSCQVPPPTPPVKVCDPDRKLTLADFKEDATLPVGKAGKTAVDTPRVQDGGKTIFQAKLLSRSAMRPETKDPKDRSKSGCGDLTKSCKDIVAKGKTFRAGNQPGCPAAPQFDSTKKATNDAECDSVIGTECDRVKVEDSARVLKHEQLHFDIACVLTKKANAALAAGGNIDTIEKALKAKINAANKKYDDESKHGCDASQQSSWESDVNGGLTKVTVP